MQIVTVTTPNQLPKCVSMRGYIHESPEAAAHQFKQTTGQEPEIAYQYRYTIYIPVKGESETCNA